MESKLEAAEERARNLEAQFAQKVKQLQEDLERREIERENRVNNMLQQVLLSQKKEIRNELALEIAEHLSKLGPMNLKQMREEMLKVVQQKRRRRHNRDNKG